MDYEKLYKDALERAKKIDIDDAYASQGTIAKMIFPELSESDDERIREELIGMIKECTNWVHKKEYIAYLEKQKENPKNADSIPSDCTSDVRCEDRWHKVTDSMPDNPREVLCKDEAGNYFIGRYYVGEGWEISNYDDEDKPHHLNPPVSKWIDFPLEKQKEQKSCPDAPKEKSVDGDFYSSDKDKNLDEIAQDYVDGVKQYNQEPTWDLMQTAVCYGYHLSEEQFEKNRLANCDAVSKEECDRETDFAMEIIEKEHRQPTFNDAINYGMRLQKQKEQKPIKMEVYEVGKGTTVCGQDYKCKKDYMTGTCRYIKGAIYHCSRDGYLNDQNGASWSCTPEWFNEYIQSNTEWAEEEKTSFVSGQFLQCKLSFDEFKEGEHYWLEYIGDDVYVGRSDNVLNQKFHITPRQLYTLFSQQLEEVQGPPQEEKQVSLNYEPPFDENPSDKEIIEALIHHLNEQDDFLTAINCVSTKAILSWLKEQKEQKPNRERNKPKESWLSKAKYEIEHADELLRQRQEELREIRELKNQEQKSAEKQDYSGLNDLERAILRGFLAAGMENVPATIIKETANECLAQMKLAKWSEEDKKILDGIITTLDRLGYEEYCESSRDQDIEEDRLYYEEIQCLKKLKSIGPRQIQNVSDMITPNKEFFQWIYNRLVYVHKENPDVDYMRSFKERIEKLSFDEPSWKPSEEQMAALCSELPVVKGSGDKVQDILETLYDDLKKLI